MVYLRMLRKEVNNSVMNKKELLLTQIKTKSLLIKTKIKINNKIISKTIWKIINKDMMISLHSNNNSNKTTFIKIFNMTSKFQTKI